MDKISHAVRTSMVLMTASADAFFTFSFFRNIINASVYVSMTEVVFVFISAALVTFTLTVVYERDIDSFVRKTEIFLNAETARYCG